MPDLHIEDIGPVVEFEGSMDSPGIYELLGGHGTGKTTVLRTVTQAGGGKTDVKLTKRDGASVGTASVGGKKLRVNKTKTTEKGDLEFEGMEAFDLPTIHWPNIQDPAKRDAKRIAALVRVAGGTATIEDFGKLLDPDLWNESVDEKLIGLAADPVEMASKVKRQLDKAAKANEDDALVATGVMDAALKETEGVNFEVSTDAKHLQSVYEERIAERAALEQRRADAERSAVEVGLAKDRIREAEKSYDGLSSVDAEVSASEASKEHSIAVARWHELEAMLKESLLELGKNEGALDLANAAFKTATDHEEMMTQWKETIEKTQVKPPTSEEVVKVAEAVSAASKDVELGDAANKGIMARESAKEQAAIVKALNAKAKELRKAAAKTADVLSDAISTIEGCPLRVMVTDDGDARLVLDTDRSSEKPENFDELSDGERWIVIIGLVCKEGRVVVLAQGAYGELTPNTKAGINALCVERGAYLLTAKADDGDLRLQRYEPEIS
jgi:hypothetical protein